MPKITVSGGESFDAEATTRLVNALEDNGVDILHRCGGYAGCTTCRVTFEAGEPDRFTEAELEKLQKEGLYAEGIRLSCQILCDHDMTVKPIMRLSETDLDDAGKRPQDGITPTPEWTNRPD